MCNAIAEDTSAEVGYVGTRGMNLLRQIAINQAPLASRCQGLLNVNTSPVTTLTIGCCGLESEQADQLPLVRDDRAQPQQAILNLVRIVSDTMSTLGSSNTLASQEKQ